MCVISWLPKGELNLQSVQSQLWFHFAREVFPEFAPRVTFLRERFWADGFELARTVENPEPFLASLPSLRTVSSESEPLQSSRSCFKGHFSDLLNGLGLCACLSLFQIYDKGLFIFYWVD